MARASFHSLQKKLFRNGLRNRTRLLPPNSPDLSLIEHLCEVLDKQVCSMEVPPHNFQDLLLTSWCQIPQHAFWGPVEFMPQWIITVLTAQGEVHYLSGLVLLLISVCSQAKSAKHVVYHLHQWLHTQKQDLNTTSSLHSQLWCYSFISKPIPNLVKAQTLLTIRVPKLSTQWSDHVRFNNQHIWNTVYFLSTHQMMTWFPLNLWKVQCQANLLPHPLQMLLLMHAFLRSQVPPLPFSLSVSLFWFCGVRSGTSFIMVIHHGQWASVNWGHYATWLIVLLRYTDIKSRVANTGWRTCGKNISFNI